ncbi:MAG: HD-GYP domain-containing protein [Butyrivibrio sp.]|nr:HD-GYP domain-containing protein [Butyrivibrio sp.]
MKRITTKKLEPGMVLADNVYAYDSGKLIYAKKTVLDDEAITKLIFYSIINVLVEDEEDKSKALKHSDNNSQSYGQRIRQTKEFKAFKKEFEGCAQNFKEVIRDAIDGKNNIDIEKLTGPVLELMDKGRGAANIFDMLHNLRDYDDATYTHSINVAMISNIIAQWMKMSKEDIKVATQAGMLHDVGKLLIPNEIITKPARLTNDEYVIVKTHPTQGYNLLKTMDINEHVKNTALMHHERCDGSGYPLGLKDDKIDKFAKLVSIADVYDAMTSVRVYRSSVCPFAAIETFEKEGLRKYDTDILLTFLINIANTYLLYSVRLNDGTVGEIVFINRDYLSRPTVKCGSEYIDLSVKPNLYIKEII